MAAKMEKHIVNGFVRVIATCALKRASLGASLDSMKDVLLKWRQLGTGLKFFE